MRPTDLNTSHLCLCFVNFYLAFPVLLLVVFPLFLSTQFPRNTRFFFFFRSTSTSLTFSISFTLPFGTHLQSIEDVCILAKLDVYTSALSATIVAGASALFIYTIHGVFISGITCFDLTTQSSGESGAKH